MAMEFIRHIMGSFLIWWEPVSNFLTLNFKVVTTSKCLGVFSQNKKFDFFYIKDINAITKYIQIIQNKLNTVSAANWDQSQQHIPETGDSSERSTRSILLFLYRVILHEFLSQVYEEGSRFKI